MAGAVGESLVFLPPPSDRQSDHSGVAWHTQGELTWEFRKEAAFVILRNYYVNPWSTSSHSVGVLETGFDPWRESQEGQVLVGVSLWACRQMQPNNCCIAPLSQWGPEPNSAIFVPAPLPPQVICLVQGPSSIQITQVKNLELSIILLLKPSTHQHLVAHLILHI